jgi:hypothetical protein
MLAADLRLALDPVAFATDALGFAPDPWQARALRWAGKRLLLNCARQTGKSATAAILSLHLALYRPASLVLLVSPSLRQSSELFRRVTDLLAKLDARPELLEDNRLSCTLANSSRIVSLPSSEATIRGFSGASLIVEDEAARVPDDLYRSVRPMLAVSGGRLILMSTPFGKRGHFFEEWTNGGEAWERVQVQAVECPRITPEFLAEERASLGPWWYEQEYECRFQDAMTAAFGYSEVIAATKEGIETWKL